MAEPLLNMDLSSSKTLNPINAQDSTSDSHPTAPNETQITPQNDDVTLGEKRKRDDGDDRSLHPMLKTSLCSDAHTEEDLRSRPDNTCDPTSERAKKALKTETEAKRSVSEDIIVTEAVIDGSSNALSKCVVNFPKRWCNSKLRSFLKQEGIPFKHTKKKKTMGLGILIFEDEEQMKSASKNLDGKLVGGRRLKLADVIPQSFGKKSNKENASLDAETNDDNSKTRNVCDVVAPLARMSYADQLEQKKRSLAQMLEKLTRNARKACPTGVSLPEWILKSKETAGLPCELEGIIASPIVNGYRNKCEFSVGYSLEGKVTVGVMLGNFGEGVTAVEEAVDCPNVSEIASKYATIFQEFLQHSDLLVWNIFKNTGFWRQLAVREGRKNRNAVGAEAFDGIAEVMLIVQVSTSGVDDAHVAAEFERLAQAFVAGATSHSPTLPLTALVVQDHQGISNVAPADAPLHSLPIPKAVGDPEMDEKNAMDARIHDYISNLCFSISPTAFFQVNTLAAEKLYSLVGDWACLGPDTLLFDICCGTGAISLTLAHRVGMVIGIEMDASAVSDAHRNAEINGIKNCRFICSKAEDVMGSLLKEYLNVAKEHVDYPNISGSSNDVSEDSSYQEPENGKKESLPSHYSENNNADNDVSEASASHEPENVERGSHYSESNNTNIDVSEGSACQEPENGERASHCSENNTAEIGSGVQKDSSNNNSNQALVPIGGVQKDSSSGNGNTSSKHFKNVVAIVDPPWAGLHPTVIKALRTHPGLRRLVYISSNPKSLVANAIELCTPSPVEIQKGNKDDRGWRNMSRAGVAQHRSNSMPISEAFKPVKAMGVDLFPHTPHCELVMLLEK